MAEAGTGIANTKRQQLGAQQRFAVRQSDSEADREALDRYLEQRGVRNVERFLPEDDDELDTAVRDRRFESVVFVNLDALLAAMIKGDIHIDRWMEIGVGIELAEEPGPADWRQFVRQVQESLDRWRRTQRRRQVVACAILSAIALAAMAALFLLVPQAK